MQFIVQRRGHRLLTLLALALSAALLVLMANNALAVHDLNLFELDRNATDEGGGGDDWATLYAGGGSATDFTGVLADIGADGGTQFQAGGSKDDLDISPGGATGQYWKWEPGEPLDKDDITNAYAAAYVNTVDTGENDIGDLIIYFGLDRFANNGSAQVGFWFLQDDVGLTNTPDGGGFRFNGHHEVGDVLVQSNFTNGGVISNISVFEWVGSGGSHGTLNLLFATQDCLAPGLGADDAACATVNQGDTTAPWPFTPKFGTAGTFPRGSFFEGGINISRLVPEAECFSTFLAETRSSTPFDSRLKDFALGNFELCSANIQIAADDTNEVGDDHTFTVTVNQVVTGVSSPAPDGTPVTVTLTDDNGAVSSVSSNTCTNGTGNDAGENDGECSVTFTSDSAGTVTGHASATVTIFGDDFFVETDGVAPNSGDTVKTFVDAFITIAADDTNFIHDEHDFTCHIEADDGSGSGFDPVADATCTGAITSDTANSSFVGGNTCLTDSSGDCTLTITSDEPGVTVVSASTTVTVGGVSLSRSTDGVSPNSGPATKTWIAAAVTFTKTFEVGPFTSPGGTVCFTLSRVPAPPPPVSSDPATQCKPAAASVTFTWNNLIAGAHTITEDSSGVTPSGAYIDISDIQFAVAEDCTGVSPVCVQASASPTPFNLGTFNDPLADGALQVLKLLGPAGTPWMGPDVNFYVCQNDPKNDPTPETPCDAGNADETIVVTAANNPAASGALEEAYYTVCEEVPAGYTVSPSQCQVVQVLAGGAPAEAQVTFTNTPPLEGCTPGYWRNHLDQWVTYSPGDDFDTTFGVDLFNPDITLEQAVTLGAGGFNKLARHAVAALLNASAGLNSGFTEAQVIALVQAAAASGDAEPYASQLAASNELGCPLNS